MIRKGSIVIIRPSCSLKFAGQRGQVEKIISEDGLPIKVKFDDTGTLYGFSPEEIEEA